MVVIDRIIASFATYNQLTSLRVVTTIEIQKNKIVFFWLLVPVPNSLSETCEKVLANSHLDQLLATDSLKNCLDNDNDENYDVHDVDGNGL